MKFYEALKSKVSKHIIKNCFPIYMQYIWCRDGFGYQSLEHTGFSEQNQFSTSPSSYFTVYFHLWSVSDTALCKIIFEENRISFFCHQVLGDNIQFGPRYFSSSPIGLVFGHIIDETFQHVNQRINCRRRQYIKIFMNEHRVNILHSWKSFMACTPEAMTM